MVLHQAEIMDLPVLISLVVEEDLRPQVQLQDGQGGTRTEGGGGKGLVVIRYAV